MLGLGKGAQLVMLMVLSTLRAWCISISPALVSVKVDYHYLIINIKTGKKW